MPIGDVSAAAAVGAAVNCADASADIVVSIALITAMRVNIKNRPNIFMNFLARKRRVVNLTPMRILFATNLAAIVRALVALSDVTYLVGMDVARSRKATSVRREPGTNRTSSGIRPTRARQNPHPKSQPPNQW